MDDDPDREGLPSPTNNLPLPSNVITVGRRITPAIRVKILRALEVFPTKGQLRVINCFFMSSVLGLGMTTSSVFRNSNLEEFTAEQKLKSVIIFATPIIRSLMVRLSQRNC
jgi:hypothetical protein